jgi:subtilisin family serine protease
MASPVVAGVAALLLSYFPDLTPEQLKYCLETGSRKPQTKARIPGSDEETEFSSLCKTGGIVNAFEAVTIAASIAKPANTPTASPAPATKPKKG